MPCQGCTGWPILGGMFSEFRIRCLWAWIAGVAGLSTFLFQRGPRLFQGLVGLDQSLFKQLFVLLMSAFPWGVWAAVAGFVLAPTAWGDSQVNWLSRVRRPRGTGGQAVLKRAGTGYGWLLLVMTASGALWLNLFGHLPIDWTFWSSWLVAGLCLDAYRTWEFPNGDRVSTCFGLEWAEAKPAGKRVRAPVGPARDDTQVVYERKVKAGSIAVLCGVGALALATQMSDISLQGRGRPGLDASIFFGLVYSVLPFAYLVYRAACMLLPSGVPQSPDDLPTILQAENPLLEVVQPSKKVNWGCTIGCIAVGFFTPLWPFALLALFLPLLPVVFLYSALKDSWALLFFVPWPIVLPLLFKRPRIRQWIEFDVPTLRTIEHTRQDGYEFSSLLENGSEVTGLGVQENARPLPPYSLAVLYSSGSKRAVGGYASREDVHAAALRIANILLVPVLDPHLNVANCSEQELQKELRPWPAVEAPLAPLSDLPPIP